MSAGDLSLWAHPGCVLSKWAEGDIIDVITNVENTLASFHRVMIPFALM